MSEPSSILSRVASSLPTMRRQRPQSQAERTRRINYVKKVIRKVYQKNKKDYSSKLAKTKKRDAINLQALTTFLRNPENSGLLNRIYDMSITPTGTLSVEALADRIDPVTIPTIFSPIGVPALERARETPAEIAEARAIEEERQTIPQLERAPETEAELDRVGEGIGIGDQIQRVATQQAQVPQFLQRALGRVNVRGDKTIAERAIKQEKKESKKLVSRAERRMNVPITDSSNIPADPVANQRQEARTNRLPSLPSLPSFPPIPRIPVPTAPIANAETIRIIESGVEDQGMRRVIRDVLSGNIDPDAVEDTIISTIIRNLVGVPEPITKAIINKIRSKIGSVRYTTALQNAEANSETIVKDYIRLLQLEETERQEGMEEEEMEFGVITQDQLDDLRALGTPDEVMENIRGILDGASEENIDEVASREYEKIVKRVVNEGARNDLPVGSVMAYVRTIRNLFTPYSNVQVIAEDQIELAMAEAELGVIEQVKEERKESKEGRQSRIVEGGTAGAVGGGIAGVVSGGAVGRAGRLLRGGVAGGGAGIVGGLAGGAVGKRVGGKKGERVGQAVGGLGAGIYAGYVAGSKLAQVQEVPVQIPDQVVPQEEPLRSRSGKGTLRPRFIIPTTDILNKTNNEIQADLDEFSAFDYVLPSSEGTEGNISNNALKRQAIIQNELILNGGGITIESMWGEEPKISEEEQREQFIGDKLSPIPEMKMGVIEDENSVGRYTIMAQPNIWNAGSIKLNPYYRDYTRNSDLNNNIVRSSLYGFQH